MELETQILVRAAAVIGAGIAMGLGAVGAAIGEGYTAAEANGAISRNPEISGDIFKNMLVGQAVAESASIFALVIAILMLFLNVPLDNLLNGAALRDSERWARVLGLDFQVDRPVWVSPGNPLLPRG